MPIPTTPAPSAPRGGGSDPRVQKLSPDKVQKLLDCAKTPRVRELELLQSHVEGTAYAGRVPFNRDDVPLEERAPNVIYRLAAIATESNAAFALGDGRFPTILSLSSESDDVFDQALGLSGDDSAIIDSFNAKLIELAGLETAIGVAYRMAQASKSCALVLGYRSGLPFADLVWSKHCLPSFDDPTDPCKCTKLVIRYRYTEQWRDAVRTSGEWWTRVFEYLRVIDDVADTVYWPVSVWEDTDEGAVEGASPVKTRVTHGFGFCPVHWYARNRKSIVGETFDGEAVHDGLCGMLEQLDLCLSQKQRAGLYCGDPQTVITGVSDEDPIGGVGRRATGVEPTDVQGGRRWAKSFAPATGPNGGAIKRGAGQVWRISDPGGKAEMLCLPADALAALDSNAKDLAQKLCDDMGVTIVDPSVFSGGGDLSGRTLAFIFSKQINRVSQDRKNIGKCLILPVLNMFYRMLLASTDGVYLPGLKKVAPILARFYRPIGDGPSRIWFAPHLKLKWGDYFEPSDVDESTRTTTAIAAKQAGIITLKSAVEHVRSVFEIGSVDQYVDALQDETDASAARDAQQAIDIVAGTTAAKSGEPSATQSPNAAPPATGAPKAKRAGIKPGVKKAAQ